MSETDTAIGEALRNLNHVLGEEDAQDEEDREFLRTLERLQDQYIQKLSNKFTANRDIGELESLTNTVLNETLEEKSKKDNASFPESRREPSGRRQTLKRAKRNRRSVSKSK